MRKINGIVYLDEDEWENEALREEYPDALLMKTYTRMRGQGTRLYTEKFEASGYNRREIRNLRNRRRYNTKGNPSGYGAQ